MLIVRKDATPVDEPYRFSIAQDNGISVNDPGAYEAMGIGAGKGCEKSKEG